MTVPDTLVVSRDPYAPIVTEHDGRLLYRIPIESGHASFHRDFPVDPDAARVLRDDAERFTSCSRRFTIRTSCAQRTCPTRNANATFARSCLPAATRSKRS